MLQGVTGFVKAFIKIFPYAIDPETLVVLTHDGEPVGRFKLNSHSFVLGLSENEDYLYIHNNDPEVQIMRIRIIAPFANKNDYS